jgi:hypothetical protein
LRFARGRGGVRVSGKDHRHVDSRGARRGAKMWQPETTEAPPDTRQVTEVAGRRPSRLGDQALHPSGRRFDPCRATGLTSTNILHFRAMSQSWNHTWRELFLRSCDGGTSAPQASTGKRTAAGPPWALSPTTGRWPRRHRRTNPAPPDPAHDPAAPPRPRPPQTPRDAPADCPVGSARCVWPKPCAHDDTADRQLRHSCSLTRPRRAGGRPVVRSRPRGPRPRWAAYGGRPVGPAGLPRPPSPSRGAANVMAALRAAARGLRARP